MLPKSRRLTADELEAALKTGRAVHTPLFLARILKTDHTGPSKVAAVAPVKIAKTSVERHRVRRRLYSAARPVMSRLSPGYSIGLFAKQPVTTVSFKELASATEEFFVKAGLLR